MDIAKLEKATRPRWTQKHGPCEHPYQPWTVWMENLHNGYLLTCQVCGNWQIFTDQTPPHSPTVTRET